SRLELEIAPLLVVDVDAGDVSGKEVGGELDPSERAVDRAGNGLGQHGLADPGDVLDQQVTFGNEAHQSQANLSLLALNDLPDIVRDAGEGAAEPLPIRSFPARRHRPSELR